MLIVIYKITQYVSHLECDVVYQLRNIRTHRGVVHLSSPLLRINISSQAVSRFDFS